MIQLSLKKSLLISTAVYLALLVLVSMSSLSRVSDMQKMAVKQQNKAVLVQQRATQIQLNLLQQIKLSSASLAADNEVAVTELASSYQNLRQQFEQNFQQFKLQDQQTSQPLLKQLATSTHNYSQSAKALFDNSSEIFLLTAKLDDTLLKFELAADELGAQILDIAYADHADNSTQVEAIANQLDTALFTIIGIGKEVYSVQKKTALEQIEESLSFALSDYKIKKDYLSQNLQPQMFDQQIKQLDQLAFIAFALLQDNNHGLLSIKKQLLASIHQQKVLHQTGEHQVNDALAVAEEIKLAAEQNMSDIQKAVGENVEAAKQMALIIMLISLAVGAVTYWLTIKAIITPISGIAKVVAAIASGDLTRQLRTRGNDELGQLSGDINKMTDNLLSLVKLISDVSGQLNRSAQLAFDKNSHLGQQLAVTLDLSAKTQHNTQQVEESALKVSSDLEVFAEHMNDNVIHVKNSRDNCVNSKKLVHQLNSQAKQSGQNIEQLKRRSSEINNIVDTIEKIAEQTNLLALNAAIEAARAGELGRGFAVVADEVRELASRTQNSTLQIQSIIAELLKEIDCAYVSMQSSIETSTDVTDSISLLDNSMEKIKQDIETIQLEFGQTLAALKQQSESIEDVNDSVSRIEGIADKNVQTAADAVKQSEQISLFSEKLNQVIQRFKIN